MSSDNKEGAGLTRTDLAAILADAFAPWVQDLNLSVEDIGSDGITMQNAGRPIIPRTSEATQKPLILSEPAEHTLAEEIDRRRPVIEAAVSSGDGYRRAFAEAAQFKPAVDKFFDDVLVMAPNPIVRESRLRLLKRLELLILKLADISEIVAEDNRA